MNQTSPGPALHENQSKNTRRKEHNHLSVVTLEQPLQIDNWLKEEKNVPGYDGARVWTKPVFEGLWAIL